ncbi:uncharacterized protein BDZ99DRAFT_553586 [Mytilinidion resinicola]|uniref:Uncharacterized protein n=1 Tax=Mytilinidion resinicola TaxID=574789 RepID=A0A6A6YY22_9PEZI|nr:uncharacterized protein BDZ99DRAFT_553586 [Mytilinidion resinicola]KAF2813721.1 hypothetical protein BDZ99DRAFT_553586 [Mytilinidion resinicola]
MNPLYRNKSSSSIQPRGLDAPWKRSEWLCYFDLVRQYSQMDLTYASDELAAFAGILGRLGTIYDTQFFAGLPISALLIGLHWIPGYEEGVTYEPSSERRESFPSWSWAGRNGPIEWLEAVVMPDWWQWVGSVLPDPTTNIQAAELNSGPAQIHIRSQIRSVKGLSAELSTASLYPESLLNSGKGNPTPFIKIFDSQGRWCGRIYHSSPDVIAGPNIDEVGLMLLSTCSTRKTCMCDTSGETE